MQLTDAEHRLLDLLRENARLSTAEIARRSGLSRTTVQTRVQRLQDKGVIAGYTIRLGRTWMSRHVEAQVQLSVQPDRARAVECALTAMACVSRVYTAAGAFDLLVLLACRDAVELEDAVDTILSVPGVERTETTLLLSRRFDRETGTVAQSASAARRSDQTYEDHLAL
ncbi:MAG: Lrp/AsnC family transcriptional regulator [Pseudomonadota bacterium]